MPISPGSMRIPVSRAKTWQKVPAPCRLVPRSQPLALKITRGPSGNRRWPFRRGQHSRSSLWNLALSTTYIRRALQACLRTLPRARPKWRTSRGPGQGIAPDPFACHHTRHERMAGHESAAFRHRSEEPNAQDAVHRKATRTRRPKSCCHPSDQPRTSESRAAHEQRKND